MKRDSAHIVPLEYPGLALVRIQLGHKSALTQSRLRSQLRGITRHQNPKRTALYRAEIRTGRTLKTTTSLPDRTTSVGHFERKNKLIIIRRERSVDTYLRQYSFLRRTWWFARLREVMEDNLSRWLAVRYKKHFQHFHPGCLGRRGRNCSHFGARLPALSVKIALTSVQQYIKSIFFSF